MAVGKPKSGDGKVEIIRTLRAARCSAVKSKTQAVQPTQEFGGDGPNGLRDRLRGLSTKALATEAAQFRPGERPDSPEEARKLIHPLQ